MKADQADRPLGIFQGDWRLRVRAEIWSGPRGRNSIFQEHACNPTGYKPIACLGAFEINGEDFVSAAREHDHRSARVLARWRVDRHRRLRDIADVGPRFSCDQFLRFGSYGLRLRERPRIGRCPRPYRHLRMPRRRLPHGLLRAHSTAPNYRTNREGPTLSCSRPKNTHPAIIHASSCPGGFSDCLNAAIASCSRLKSRPGPSTSSRDGD